jgi:hypothetical protein
MMIERFVPSKPLSIALAWENCIEIKGEDSKHRHDVAYWHYSDFPSCPSYVRYRRQRGHRS